MSGPSLAGFCAGGVSRRAVLHRAIGAGATVALAAASRGGKATPAAAQEATPAGAPPCSAATPGPAAGTPTAGSGRALCVALGQYNLYFSPNLIVIPADEAVAFQITNHAQETHNFSDTDHKNPDVENLGISEDVAPGETKAVIVEAPAGTYYFFCNEPGHEQDGMFGYLEAKKDATITTSDVTATPRAG